MSDENKYSGMNFNPYTGERIEKASETESTARETEPKKAADVEMYGFQMAQSLEDVDLDKAAEPENAAKAQETAKTVASEAKEEMSPMEAFNAALDESIAKHERSAKPREVREGTLEYDLRMLEEEEKAKKKVHKVRKERSEKKSGGFFRKAAAAVALAVIFGAVAGGTFYGICTYTGVWKPTEKAETMAPAIANANTDLTKTATSTGNVSDHQVGEVKLVNSEEIHVVSTDISDMVEQVIPAMVTIVNTGKDAYDFWGRSYASQSSGTGVIIGENETELLIVTNHHVAKEAKQLDITFVDDVTVQARVKGMDSDMDIAVLAVSLEDIPDETKEAIMIAQLGDSDSLKLGQPAVVIGNALGIGISVTDGIISGLNREMTTEDGKTGTFIQTDAAVNHGNSGGALLNVKGEVIGIVSNKIDGESVEGMGYAIPISAASPIIAELMERQTRTQIVDADEQGYLGVSLQSVTSEARAYYDLPEGGYVYYVSEGSGAQQAGIQKGDVITKIEKMSVSSNAEAREILQYYRQGEEVTVTYSRLEGGEYVSHEVIVVLGAPEMK